MRTVLIVPLGAAAALPGTRLAAVVATGGAGRARQARQTSATRSLCAGSKEGRRNVDRCRCDAVDSDRLSHHDAAERRCAAHPTRAEVTGRAAFVSVQPSVWRRPGRRVARTLCRGRRLGLLTGVLAGLALVTPIASASSPCAAEGLSPTRENVAAVRGATLCLLNVERARHGMKALSPTSSCARARSDTARPWCS